MTESELKRFAEKMKGIASNFDALGKELPKLLNDSKSKLSTSELETLDNFTAEAKKIASSKLSVFQKMNKIQELKEQYGNSNDNK